LQSLDACPIVIGNKRRCHARPDRCIALEQDLGDFHGVGDFLGILRTYDKTRATEDTVIPNDMSLISGKPNGLDRTMSDTFVTILAVGFF
jgi:hypothetical protein